MKMTAMITVTQESLLEGLPSLRKALLNGPSVEASVGGKWLPVRAILMTPSQFRKSIVAPLKAKASKTEMATIDARLNVADDAGALIAWD